MSGVTSLKWSIQGDFISHKAQGEYSWGLCWDTFNLFLPFQNTLLFS